MNGTEEVSRRFVVARGDGSILFEASEEVLDQVPRLVQVTVIVTLHLAGSGGRNHDLSARLSQRLDHSLCPIRQNGLFVS